MTATAEQLADDLANLTARLRLALDHLEAADDPEGADVLFMAPDLLSALDDLEGVARKGDVADAPFEWMEAEDQLISLVDLADQLAPPRLEWITFPDSRELATCCALILEAGDMVAKYAGALGVSTSPVPFPYVRTAELAQREGGPDDAELRAEVRERIEYPRRAIPLSVFLDELGMDDAEPLEEESLPPFPPAGWAVVRPGGNEVH